MRISVFFTLVIIFFTSCQQSKKIRIAASLKGSSTEKVGEEIAEYLNYNDWEIEILSGGKYFGYSGIKTLQNDEVEMAFNSNDMKHEHSSGDIRTVMPLYPNLSYIFYRNHMEPKSLDELITNNTILMASQEDGNFFMNLFDYYGLDLDNLKIENLNFNQSVAEIKQQIYDSESNVICIFAAIQNPHVKELIENGWEIFSLGDINLSNRGSSVEGFCMNHPRTKPFIIPKNFFGRSPKFPIYTISLNEVIIAKSSIDDDIIYDFVKSIYEGKHYLAERDILLTHIKEDFNRNTLNFPLHQGTINFLERNKPSIYERYAEAFGVIFSILVVLYGAITSLKKIRKERIDKYYKRVVECQNIKDLELLSNEAVSQLQNEKLTADESFTIFLNLVEKRRVEIENSHKN